jgi:NADP-dependent 3-hydroxy acid dehydrogenase YdfG
MSFTESISVAIVTGANSGIGRCDCLKLGANSEILVSKQRSRLCNIQAMIKYTECTAVSIADISTVLLVL